VNRFRPLVIAAIAGVTLAALPLLAGAQTRADAGHPDVLVVGGTPAGVAAALAAARRGERVTLVSAAGDLGGILSDGMMDQWDLNLAPDGSTVERGIFSEMYARLGPAFEPATAARVFADMVAAEPRITVWYDESPIAVRTHATVDGTHVDGVVFRARHSGKTAQVDAPFVIDASDSGDVAALAGAHYDLGRQDTGIDERTQAVTLMFAVDGVDWPALAASYDDKRDGPGGVTDHGAWGYADLMRGYQPLSPNVVVRGLNLGRLRDGSVTFNAIDVVGIDGLDPKQLALARQLTMREAPHLLDFLRAHQPGFTDAKVSRFARDVYVRETRHISGLERLTTNDVWDAKVPADSIGLASYPLDVHPVTTTDEPAFAPTRHVYGVPFGALVPKGLDNLLVASPAISASHVAAGSARIVPTTIEEGEAAGVASALARATAIDFVQLAGAPERIVALRGELSAEGVLVGEPSATHVAYVKGNHPR
jgi:hypothetical protein